MKSIQTRLAAIAGDRAALHQLDEWDLFAVIVTSGSAAQIVEALRVLGGLERFEGRQFLLGWASVLKRLTADPQAFSQGQLLEVAEAHRAGAAAVADARLRRATEIIALVARMRWQRMASEGLGLDAWQDAGDLRGAPMIEAERCSFLGVRAAQRGELEEAKQHLLGMCRVRVDSVFRICGVDRQLADVLSSRAGLDDSALRQCSLFWSQFDVATMSDYCGSTLEEVGNVV